MSLLGGGGGGSKARVTMSFYMTFFYFDGVPYISNLGLLRSLEPLERFVVGGGGGLLM